MIRNAWTIYRCGVVLLLAPAFWTPITACADSDTANDVKQVRKLAEHGSVSDEFTLAGDYFTGRGVPQDSTMAAYWYERAAGHGNPAAQNQIGYFYQVGIGVPVDPKRALHWYQLASASGFVKAKVNMAVVYLHGIGVPKNEELAAQLLTQAYQAGNGTAATYLGILYFFGIGVPQDKAAAERWFESGLKLHDPAAAFDLGSMYSVEPDHPHDLPKALALLRRAADAGFVQAMHSLGLLLVNHPELEPNAPQEARVFLEQAANAGCWKSSATLGILARNGWNMSPDPKEAYLQFRIAVLQGGAPANQFLKLDIERLEAKLESQERRTAESAAKTWYEHHPLTLAFVYKEGTQKSAFPIAAIAVAPEGSFAGQLIPLGSS